MCSRCTGVVNSQSTHEISSFKYLEDSLELIYGSCYLGDVISSEVQCLKSIVRLGTCWKKNVDGAFNSTSYKWILSLSEGLIV
uniref:Uncharacterized protein n=1 Tax=Octopus bimaculoides TaxID=37653 RepID=A0A0L8H2D5_OCTBM